MTSGFQTSVSGKYFRSRGVNSGFSADAVPCIVFATVLASSADSVFKVTTSALTSTASDTVPTCKVASKVVVEPGCTGTRATVVCWKPVALKSISYIPAEGLEIK